MKEGMTISITTSTIFKAVAVLIGLWLVYFLREIVLVVLAAVVIASALEPAVGFFQKWRVPRLIAVICIYVLLFLFLFGMFYFFVPTFVDDLASFIAAMPSYLETVSHSVAIENYAFLLGFSSPAEISTDELIANLRASVNPANVFGSSFSAAATVLGGVFSFILIIVFSFYFTVAETGVDDFLRVIAPRKYQPYLLNLWFRARHKIGLWMQGQIILALLIGVLVYLSLTILRVEHALLLAVLAAVLELIPVFGPTLAAVPAILIGFADGGLALGLGIVALYVIIQQFENHLIYPLVVTRVVGVPPLLVILGLIIGWSLFGFLGILLSVPVVAAIQEFVRDWSQDKIFVEEAKTV